MPFGSVTLRPGINTEATPTLNEAGYSVSSLGRFRAGLFEKLGGFTKFYANVVGSFIRALLAWQDLLTSKHLAFGATAELGIITSGALSNITPQTTTTNTTISFSTTAGSNLVTVTDTVTIDQTFYNCVELLTPVSVGGIILSGVYPIKVALSTTTYQIEAATAATSSVVHGGAVPVFTTVLGTSDVLVTLNDHAVAIADVATFPVSTSVGGCTIIGNYAVTAVPTANTFRITAAQLATASTSGTMNGGQVRFFYYIAVGPLPSSSGYSVGTYSGGTYSVGSSPSGTTGTPITTTDWSLANWGEILLACPTNSGIYYWEPNGGFTAPALVGTAPSRNTGIFISNAQQILICFGSTEINKIGMSQDPLLVKWSDSGDYTNFAVSSRTQAGSFRIPSGSMLVGGMAVSQRNLLWTDRDLWEMGYLGPPLVYGFNQIGAGCGLIGMHAATQMRDAVYWMGISNFYVLTGSGVSVIPCTVWDVVYQNLDTANQRKCFAAADTPFNEVFFFYPSLSGGTGECDSYVKLNITEPGNPWDFGPMSRLAWIDQSVLGNPIGAAPSGAGSLIYQHETSPDADGNPLNASFTTGYFYIAEGEEFAFVDQVLPDMKWGTYAGAQTAQVQLTFHMVDFPGDTPRDYGPYNVTQATQYVTTRMRGRQMAVTASSNDVGSFWRLGKIRYRYQPDGRR